MPLIERIEAQRPRHESVAEFGAWDPLAHSAGFLPDFGELWEAIVGGDPRMTACVMRCVSFWAEKQPSHARRMPELRRFVKFLCGRAIVKPHTIILQRSQAWE